MKFEGGKLAIFGGVNRLTGSYGLINGKVVMSDLVSTSMAGPAELMDQESSLAKTLPSRYHAGQSCSATGSRRVKSVCKHRPMVVSGSISKCRGASFSSAARQSRRRASACPDRHAMQ